MKRIKYIFSVFVLLVQIFIIPITVLASNTHVSNVEEIHNFSIGPAGTPQNPLFPWILGGEGHWTRDDDNNSIKGEATIHLDGVWTLFWTYSIKGRAQYADGGKEIIKNYASQKFTLPGTGFERKKYDCPINFDLSGEEYDHTRPVTFVFWLFKNTMNIDETPPTPPIPPIPPKTPEIKTNATNAKDNTKVLPAEEKAQIKDAVDYKNLIPGKEYELKGKLMDKNTNKPLLVDGKEVTSAKKFTPKEATGKAELLFEFNASTLHGKKIVVFEDLYQDGKKVATHSDINDANQTVDVPEQPKTPEIKTNATNAKDNTKVLPAEEKAQIKDAVDYKNLIPGKEYELKGKLMDKNTNKPLLVDGKEVTSAKKFTPKESTGKAELLFEFNASTLHGKKIVVFEDLYQDGKKVATHSDINDANQTVDVPEQPKTPEIKTNATNAKDNTKVLPAEEKAQIKDAVDYKNLIPGKEYELKGKLMDKNTNKPLLVDGKEVTSAKKFTPKESTGKAELLFEFNASTLHGKKIVVFEDLYQDGKKVATHSDINDANQTVDVPEQPKTPEIKTNATNAKDNTKVLPAEEKAQIKDAVDYKNLIPGKEYELKGKLMDKNTNKPLLVDGKEVTSAKKFTPKEATGKAELLFEFNASTLHGKKIVVFEDLYQDGKKVATHSDINDANQTVDVPEQPKTPEIKTNATNAKDNTKVLPAEEKAQIKDAVDYKNLIPGKEYELKGKLMDKNTNKPLLVDGKEVTSAKKFTPKESTGKAELLFEFNASTLHGKKIVVFEDLYQDGKKVATHSDINDANQTVDVPEQPKTPEIKTNATNAKDNTKVLPAEEKAQIKDAVDYKNLIPGKEYELKGKLMDKNTNKPLLVDGKEVTSAKKFTPKESTGKAELLFEFNASTLHGKKIVVFEDLYQDGKKVATHSDINDANQTVDVPEQPKTPEIKTNATNAKDNTKVLPAEEKAQIKDAVDYKNLIPGKEYELKGKLMDKNTNKPLLVDGKEVTSAKKFTPKESTGKAELLFEFNASTLHGKKIVVFEDLYQDGKKVATHSDINDVAQTVFVKTNRTPVNPNNNTLKNNPSSNSWYSKFLPKTGEKNQVVLRIVGVIILLILAAIGYKRFKKSGY